MNQGFNEEYFMQKTVKLVKQKLPLLDTEVRKALKDFVQNGKENLKDFLENDLEIHIPKKVKNYQKFVNFLMRNKKILEAKSNKLKEYVRSNQWEYVKFVVQLLDLKPMDYGVSGLTFCDKVLICEYVSEVSTVTEGDTLDHYFNEKFPSENLTSENHTDIFKKANVTDLVEGNLPKNGSTDFFDLKKDDFFDGFATTLSPVDEESNVANSVPETTENEGLKTNATIRFPELEEPTKLPLDSTLFDELKEVFTNTEKDNLSSYSSNTEENSNVSLDSPFFNNLTEAFIDDQEKVDFLQDVFQMEDSLLTMNEMTSMPVSSTEEPIDQILSDFQENVNLSKNESTDFFDLKKDDFFDGFATTLSLVDEESNVTHSVPKTTENEGLKTNATIRFPTLEETNDMKAETWTINSDNEPIGNVQL